jgi:hypothetical protein
MREIWRKGSAMMRRFLLAVAASFCFAGTAQVMAQTPVDGRIVRVVYQVVFNGTGPRDSTWGFHLAHMQDGRYCVRFGNPGRLNLTIIHKVSDICFDGVPATTDRSGERRSQSLDTGQKGKLITVVSYQQGSIASSGNDVFLDIATCNRVDGESDTRCFPNRYVVHMSGPDCIAEVTLASASSRPGTITCEHYEAR